MRYVITANWRGKTVDGEVKHFNPMVLECDDRQDAFRVAYNLSDVPGCESVEIKDKEAAELVAQLIP